MSILQILLIVFGLALGIFGTISEGRIQGKLTRAGVITVFLLVLSAITSLISYAVSESQEKRKYLSIIKQTNRLMYALHLSDANLYFVYDLKDPKYAHIREILVSRFSASELQKFTKELREPVEDEPTEKKKGGCESSNIVGYVADEKGGSLLFSLDSKRSIESIAHSWTINCNSTNTPADLLIRKLVFNPYYLAFLPNDPLKSPLHFNGTTYFDAEYNSSNVGLMMVLNESPFQNVIVTYNPRTMKLSFQRDFKNISGQSGNGRIISILDLPKSYVALHGASDELSLEQDGPNIWPAPHVGVRLSIGFFRSMRVILSNKTENPEAPFLLSSPPLSCEQAGIKGLLSEEELNFVTK